MKTGRILPLLSTLLCLTTSSTAFAWGVHLESNVLPGYSQTNTAGMGFMGGNFDGTALNAESGFSYDLRNTIGVRPLPGLMVGFTYNYGVAPSKRDASDGAPSVDRSLKNSELGPAIGFFLGNVRLIASYLVSGSLKLTDKSVDLAGAPQSDLTVENKGASGYQLVLGYSFNITPVLKIGPTLVYRKIEYKKQDFLNNLAGADPAFNYTDKEFTTKAVFADLQPMVSLLFSF